MFKKSLFLLFFIFGFGTSVSAMDEPKAEDSFSVIARATIRGISFSSAGKDEYKQIAELVSGKKFNEGLPGYNEEGKFDDDILSEWFNTQNLNRQTGAKKNLFHTYQVAHPEKGPVGFIHFGRMPTVAKYDPVKHAAIIGQFMTLGVTKKNDSEGGLEFENIARVENRGLATMLPILNDGLDEGIVASVLQASFSFAQKMAGEGYTLPVEGTAPHQLIGLFSPEDPLLPLLQKAGFTVIEDKGFVEFYPPKPRLLIHQLL